MKIYILLSLFALMFSNLFILKPEASATETEIQTYVVNFFYCQNRNYINRLCVRIAGIRDTGRALDEPITVSFAYPGDEVEIKNRIKTLGYNAPALWIRGQFARRTINHPYNLHVTSLTANGSAGHAGADALQARAAREARDRYRNYQNEMRATETPRGHRLNAPKEYIGEDGRTVFIGVSTNITDLIRDKGAFPIDHSRIGDLGRYQMPNGQIYQLRVHPDHGGAIRVFEEARTAKTCTGAINTLD